MFISSVVVEPSEYDLYISLLRQRSDMMPVWFALQRGPGQAPDQSALKGALADYLGKGDTPQRRFALRYWVAADFHMLRDTWQVDRDLQDDVEKTWKDKRALVDTLLAAIPPAAPAPSAADSAAGPAPVAVLR
jgi:hypothetical protein